MIQLGRFPRANLADLPTPLEKAEGFTERLGGPSIFLKRDDKTGLGLGGNKARKLEFLLADALEQGADTVITTGGVQSNHACLTAAAARQLGLQPVLVLNGEKPEKYRGNLLLDQLMKADVHFVVEEEEEAGEEVLWEVASDYEERGYTPYVIPLGGSVPLGTLGYVAAMEELVAQANERRMVVDHIVLAGGSGGTEAGVYLGLQMIPSSTVIHVVSVSREAARLRSDIIDLTNDTAAFLDVEPQFEGDKLKVYDDYVGDGYAVPTEEGLQAIGLLAQTEGVFTDPVYTGKALAGMCDLIDKGKFAHEENVVFLHTGGVPGLFAMQDDLDL